MNFGPDHYVPVLKVKLGEKKALQGVAPANRSHITPLLEIVENKPGKNLSTHLDTAFKDLSSTTQLYARCFLDAREIAPDGQAGAAEVFQRASAAGIVFTPVTGVSRTIDVTPALAHREHGLAIRLIRAELEQGGLAGRIEVFLTQHGLAPEQLDLIIDLGPVEDFITEGIQALTDAFMAEVPHHHLWRTFTISSCAFPRNMGGVNRDSHVLTERGEWLAWRSHLYDQRQDIRRLPTFSDCAIQHPSGVEGFDFRIMAASASIRYTLEEEWLLIKGQSTKVVRVGDQFPDLARKLVYGELQSRYFGESHCAGCQLMKAAADGAPGLGSAGKWRQLCTTHHLSVVAQALASLPWP